VSALEYLLEDQNRMAKARNYFAWQARLVRPHLGRRVVEVGCGIGNFTATLLDRDLVVAVDAEESCVTLLLHRYRQQENVQAYALRPDSPDFHGLVRFQPDSCVCLNVLEHIDDDRQAVRAMASILGPGGSVVLLLPAFPALRGPIDRRLKHFRRYRRRDVFALAQDAGLKIRALHFVNFVGFFGWWMNARIFHRDAQSDLQIAIFDRLIVPPLSRLESLLPPPFGQSLFTVLEKQ
jgi:SAM-dependent methyltransferase